MKLLIVINSENAAFADDPHGEARRIVQTCAGILETHLFDEFERPLLDHNGNRVGSISWKEAYQEDNDQ